MTSELIGANALNEINRRMEKARRTVRLRPWTYERIQNLGMHEYNYERARTYLTASLCSGAGAVILAALWFFTGWGSWGYPAGAAFLLAMVASHNLEQRREHGENIVRCRHDLANGQWPPPILENRSDQPYVCSWPDVSVVEVDMDLDAINEIIEIVEHSVPEESENKR